MIGSLALLLACGFLIAHLATVAIVLWRLRPNRKQAGFIGLPRVTLLRPVCGLDTFDAETLESSFLQDYPDYEVIFCADLETDPAVPLLRRLIAAYPKLRAQVLIGKSAISGNPKLNNLAKGWRAAQSDWICMTDSNLLLPRDYLRQVVQSWGPNTGLVSSPPVGSRPSGFAGSLECAFLNSNQARLQLTSDSLGMGFAQGKTLFWNRKILERGGGLAVLGRYLAEDVSATKLVRAQGLHVTLTPAPFAQPIGKRGFSQVLNRQIRWSRVRRDGFPALFAMEFLNGAAVPLLVMALATATLPLPPLVIAGYAALWYGAETILIRRAGWPGHWRDLLALPVRDALLPVLWGVTFLRRGIEWRGNLMQAAPQKPAAELNRKPAL
ncbi:MAG: glycosyltransferase [Rhodobacteraceae bacterium]|nr:glycosyltransferase [Paracoccaceae bacterium]